MRKDKSTLSKVPRRALTAIKAVKLAGGYRAVGAFFDISPQAIYQWCERGVPANRCVQFEALLQNRMTKEQLRPDVYGAPSKDAP